MDMNYFVFISYGTMILILMRALAHYIICYRRLRQWKPIDHEDLGTRIKALSQTAPSNWHRLLGNEWPDHPAAQSVIWAIQKPIRLSQRDLISEHLMGQISEAFDDLIEDAGRTGGIAPMAGLFFTIIGMMLFSLSSIDTLTAKLMIQTMGPALGTTALGSLIAILEKNLIDGRLATMQRQYYRQGMSLAQALNELVLTHRASSKQRAVIHAAQGGN